MLAQMSAFTRSIFRFCNGPAVRETAQKRSFLSAKTAKGRQRAPPTNAPLAPARTARRLANIDLTLMPVRGRFSPYGCRPGRGSPLRSGRTSCQKMLGRPAP
jgi:hypothetical protein